MLNKISVLLVSAHTDGSPGGMATWTKEYLSAGEEEMFDISLVNTAQIGSRREQGNSKIKLTEELIRTKNIFRQLKQLTKSNVFDVAHVNTSCGPLGLIRDYLCVKKIKKHNIPVIVHFHCDIPFWVTNFISRSYLKKIAVKADKLLVLCDNSKEFLISKTGTESEKISNFVDESLCLTESKKINENIQKIVFVGYIQPEKGIYEIYDLAKEFCTKDFLLAGEVRDDVNIEEKPENLTFLGRVDEKGIIALLDEADLFLFPTHSEGFSLSLSEAMSRGLPVIATDVGANKDMIENSGGRIVKIGDVKSMKSALCELEKASLRAEMSAWCVNKVQSSYTTPIIMGKFRSIYKEVINKSGDKNE